MSPLSPQLLVLGYSRGIFPMAVEGEIQWFSPDPRAILPLDAFHASRSLMQTVRNGGWEIRSDSAFEAVMRGCAKRTEGTWISDDIVRAYVALHRSGLAHSIEVLRNGELVGGLYGVSLGGAFFGESMFHRERDASKVALVALVDHMKARGYALLDVQFLTPHLARFGAIEIPRREYLRRLASALRLPRSWADKASDVGAELSDGGYEKRPRSIRNPQSEIHNSKAP